jgi:hypothetical protein
LALLNDVALVEYCFCWWSVWKRADHLAISTTLSPGAATGVEHNQALTQVQAVEMIDLLDWV